MNIVKIMEVIEKVFSRDHSLVIHVNGICGIEDYSGNVEIDFGSLQMLYNWVEGRLKSAS